MSQIKHAVYRTPKNFTRHPCERARETSAVLDKKPGKPEKKPLRLNNNRHDHRPAAVFGGHPAADSSPDRLRERMGVPDTVSSRFFQCLDDLWFDLVEDGFVGGEPSGVYFWANNDAARLGVDG